MKLFLGILSFLFASSSIFAQNEKWSKYFVDNRVPYLIENYGESDLILIEAPAYNDPDFPGFKIVDTEGNLKKKVETDIDGRPFVKKTNVGYLLNYIDFGNQDSQERNFTCKYFDQNLNLHSDTSLKINLTWCFPDFTGLCYVGSFQSFMNINDSTIFTVGSIGHKFDSTILFSALISNTGVIKKFYIDNKWSNLNFESTADLKILPNNDTSFYLSYQGNFELRDFNLNIIKKVDYTGTGSKQIRGWYVSDFVRLKDSGFLMVSGSTLLNDDFTYDPRVTFGTWSENLVFDINDTVNLRLRPVNEAFHNILTSGHNQVILEENPEQEVYYSIFSYFNQLSIDTNSTRILLVKYNSDLDILCSKTYVARDREIIIYGSIKNPDGKYYAATLSSTKEFNYQDLNSEIISINSDCTIDGMETLEDYLGELSKFDLKNLFGIKILQNPIDRDLILFSSENVFPNDLKIKIFDSSGRLISTSNINHAYNQIRLPFQDFDSGLYIYQLISGNKVIRVEKFIKK